MKLAVTSNTVIRSNVGEEHSFRISQSAKMFAILSDTMYKNKIGSMVREVCCNAYDSHVQAGWADLPFTVHVPDEFEPWFSVTDTGIGLDDEGVKNVFTVYGESTKDESNEMIGAFGLGAKTPFAYTDAFTIITTKDGVTRHYAAFKNEHGIPAVTLMDETATGNESGVTIQIPVINHNDFNKFRREISDQLTFFTVKPTLLNTENSYPITFKDYTAGQSSFMAVEGITVGSNGSQLRGLWALQGIVGYQVDTDLVLKNIKTENAEFLKTISNSAIINFDLGTLEVTASREGISYTSRTFASFNEKLDAAREALATTISAEIEAMDGPWNKAFGINTNDTLTRMARLTKNGFKDQYYYHTSAGYYVDLERVANLEGVKGQDAGEIEVLGDEKVNDENLSANLKIVFRNYRSETIRRVRRWKENGVGKGAKADGYFMFVFRDTSDKPIVRIREYMEQEAHGSSVYVVENRDGTPVTDDQKKEILSRIGKGFTSFKNLSDVELPSPEARASRPGYKSPTAYTFETGCGTRNANDWTREFSKITDWEEGAYYIVVNRRQIDMPKDGKVLCAMHTAGLLDRPIAAIREKDIAKLANNPKWIPLAEKAEEVVDSIVSNQTMVNCYALLHSVPDFDTYSEPLRDLLKSARDKGQLPKGTALDKLFRMENLYAKLRDRAATRGFSSIASLAFKQRGTDTVKYRDAIAAHVNSVKDEIATAYPLLAFIETDSVWVDGKWTETMNEKVAAHTLKYVVAVS